MNFKLEQRRIKEVESSLSFVVRRLFRILIFIVNLHKASPRPQHSASIQVLNLSLTCCSDL